MPPSKGNHVRIHPGDSVRERYQVLCEIGCGNFSKVYRCIDLVQSKGEERPVTVAMKILKKEYRKDATYEYRMLQILASKNKGNLLKMPKMLDYFDFRGCPVFIMALHGASLRSRRLGIGRGVVTKNSLQQFSFQILRALQFIHDECHVVHTDLKPENILIESQSCSERSIGKQWVICDFGSASECVMSNLDSDLISTRPYRAPEVILGNKWHYASDIWSVGCILFEVAVGFRLFEVRDDQSHLHSIHKRVCKLPEKFTKRSKNSSKFFNSKGEFLRVPDAVREGQVILTPMKEFIKDDSTFLNFLQQLLELDPDKRITAAEALQHPYFDNIREEMYNREVSLRSVGMEPTHHHSTKPSPSHQSIRPEDPLLSTTLREIGEPKLLQGGSLDASMHPRCSSSNKQANRRSEVHGRPRLSSGTPPPTPDGSSVLARATNSEMEDAQHHRHTHHRHTHSVSPVQQQQQQQVRSAHHHRKSSASYCTDTEPNGLSPVDHLHTPPDEPSGSGHTPHSNAAQPRGPVSGTSSGSTLAAARKKRPVVTAVTSSPNMSVSSTFSASLKGPIHSNNSNPNPNLTSRATPQAQQPTPRPGTSVSRPTSSSYAARPGTTSRPSGLPERSSTTSSSNTGKPTVTHRKRWEDVVPGSNSNATRPMSRGAAELEPRPNPATKYLHPRYSSEALVENDSGEELEDEEDLVYIRRPVAREAIHQFNNQQLYRRNLQESTSSPVSPTEQYQVHRVTTTPTPESSSQGVVYASKKPAQPASYTLPTKQRGSPVAVAPQSSSDIPASDQEPASRTSTAPGASNDMDGRVRGNRQERDTADPPPPPSVPPTSSAALREPATRESMRPLVRRESGTPPPVTATKKVPTHSLRSAPAAGIGRPPSRGDSSRVHLPHSSGPSSPPGHVLTERAPVIALASSSDSEGSAVVPAPIIRFENPVAPQRGAAVSSPTRRIDSASGNRTAGRTSLERELSLASLRSPTPPVASSGVRPSRPTPHALSTKPSRTPYPFREDGSMWSDEDLGVLAQNQMGHVVLRGAEPVTATRRSKPTSPTVAALSADDVFDSGKIMWNDGGNRHLYEQRHYLSKPTSRELQQKVSEMNQNTNKAYLLSEGNTSQGYSQTIPPRKDPRTYQSASSTGASPSSTSEGMYLDTVTLTSAKQGFSHTVPQPLLPGKRRPVDKGYGGQKDGQERHQSETARIPSRGTSAVRYASTPTPPNRAGSGADLRSQRGGMTAWGSPDDENTVAPSRASGGLAVSEPVLGKLKGVPLGLNSGGAMSLSREGPSNPPGSPGTLRPPTHHASRFSPVAIDPSPPSHLNR